MVRFSPWSTFLRIFRSFCCSEISTSSASFVMSNRYWNHVANTVSNLWSLWWAGEQVKVRVPGDSAGTSAGGLHSHHSGSTGAPRSWSSCQSARPRARSCGRWSRTCWWGDRRPLPWRTCTSLWTTSCRSENTTMIFIKRPEILKRGVTRGAHQNSPSSATVMPRLPRSVLPTFDHSSELTTKTSRKAILKSIVHKHFRGRWWSILIPLTCHSRLLSTRFSPRGSSFLSKGWFHS